MKFKKSLETLKYDTRMLEFNLQQGIITQEEYEKFLKALPDDQNNREFLSFEGEQESSTETH